MKQENNFDEFDKMLFDFFENNKDIPPSTSETIKNALNKKNKKTKMTTFITLKRVAIFILCFSLVTVSAVFSKDIINFINKIFNNSNPGIDTAVNNGYVQNIDMDFIIDNNFGVKSDYVLMDDYNLDISFIYKYYNDKVNIKQILFTNVTIKDENNNVLYYKIDGELNTDNQIFQESVYLSNEVQKIDSTTIRSSILVTSNKFPLSRILYIEFKGFDIIEENSNITHIDGNWSFSINLENKFTYRNTENYFISNSEYIDNISTVISDTSLYIELQLNTEINNETVLNNNSIILKDKTGKKYEYNKISSGNNIDNSKAYKSIIRLNYPITVYDNLEKLFLHIELDNDKYIDLELLKYVN